MANAGASTSLTIVPNPAAKTEVWEHFGYPGGVGGGIATKSRVICRLCQKDMPYKNNTTNLYSHLDRHHKDVYVKMLHYKQQSSTSQHQQPSLQETIKKTQPLSKSSERHKKLANAVGQFIAKDLQPISVVDGEGFKFLMEVAEPRFTVPSRTYFTNTLLPAMYVDVQQKVRVVLSAANYCSVTTDLWTSKYQTRAYITLTCHLIDDDWNLNSFVLTTSEVAEDHTSENLVTVLDTLMKEWEIRETVVGTSTDNGSNIIKAVKEMGLFNMPCVGHTLNLAVKKSFEINRVARALARIRKLVGHFHRSNKAASRLREKQQLLGIKDHCLINDCVTRWGSTYDMLVRFTEQQQAICAVLLDNREDRQLMPTDEEISIVEELIVILKSFREATEIMSGEKYPSLGIVLPLLKKILSTLIPKEGDISLVREVKNTVRTDLESRYQNDQVKRMLRIATFLDPRFKTLPFVETSERLEIKMAVVSELTTFIESKEGSKDAPELPDPDVSVPPKKKKKLENFLQDIMGSDGDTTESQPSAIASSEVDRYHTEAPLPLACKNPLTWWKLRATQYVHLSELAKKILCIPATSVPSERVFSVAGNIINEKRSRLKSDNVDKLIFLYENMS